MPSEYDKHTQMSELGMCLYADLEHSNLQVAAYYMYNSTARQDGHVKVAKEA